MFVSWSPDQKKLLIYGYLPTFDIAFADGSPMLITEAEAPMGGSSDWPTLFWHTDELIEDLVYSPLGMCDWGEYYYAISGELLLQIWDCDNTKQNTILSPNVRWLVSDQSKAWLEERETNLYTIYDFASRSEMVLVETNVSHLVFFHVSQDSAW